MCRVSVVLTLVIICCQTVLSANSSGRTFLRLTVTMTDAEGDRLVPGLSKEDFRIFDRGSPQFVEYFSANQSPSSVTILLDMDGSMRSVDLEASLESLVNICNARSVPDEVSLIGFSSNSAVIKSFAWRVRNIDFREILRLLEKRDRYGQTGIVKAMAVSRERMRAQAKNYNRAIILITDAEEDISYSTALQIRTDIERMGMRVYAIFFPGKERLDRGRLHNLASMTGGRYFQISDPSSLELLIRWILHEMRNHYVLGFTPQPFPSKDESGKITVKLSNQRLMPGLSVRFTSTSAIGRIRAEGPGQ